jgi:hypothetical protein
MKAPEDLPPVEFWEDAIEFPVRRVIESAQSPGYMDDWIRHRSPRQVAMLRHLLGLPAASPLRERKEELREHREELVRFVPASAFASRRSILATLDVARGCLDEAELAIARDGHDRYDTTALVFAILYRSWRGLENVFHLDKLHKVGFERMRLDKPPRRPRRRFKEFLTSGDFRAVLRRYDADKRDGHTSALRQVIELRGADVVFIRRPHQESYVLTGERVVHGFTPDQIVLDFRDEAARLNIASHNHADSYELANRIASAFYGKPVKYENIKEETFSAQIQRFSDKLRKGEARDLVLVSIALKQTPLHGALDLGLNSPDNLPIGVGMAELETGLRWTIDLEHITSFTLLYNGKRVRMKLDPVRGGPAEDRTYVLHYRDLDVNLAQRPAFEELFEQEHGIKVLPTEKRGARHRS